MKLTKPTFPAAATEVKLLPNDMAIAWKHVCIPFESTVYMTGFAVIEKL